MHRRETDTNGQAAADQRVLVVDDDGLVADGLAALARSFGMDARRASPADANDIAGTFHPTVIIVSSEQALATARKIAHSRGDVPARILWLDAAAAEADTPPSETRPRISAEMDPADFRALVAGTSRDAATEAGDAHAILPAGSTPDDRTLAGLTERERTVLEELATGRTNNAIAERLSLSPNTVRTHVQNIFHKLDVGSRLEAVALAVGAGLLSIDSDVSA